MRKILLFLVLIISINSLGQNIPGYQTRQVREKLIAMSVDSGLHIPRYNGTPSGVRTGVYVADGSIAMDTTNHRLYIYSGGAWLRLANISDSSVANNPSFATNLRLQKIIDSLNAAGGFGTPTLQQVADAGSIRSWSSSGVGITISGTGADDGSAALQIGQGVNGIPIYLTNQNFSPLHQGGEWRAMHFERDVVGGSTADGLAIKQTFLLETSSASDTATKVVTGWKVSNHTNRTAFYDVRLVDSGILKTALQIQPDYLIVNNLTDTLATLQDVRDGGGGGGGISAADLPLRITGSTVSADTSVAYNPSLTTNARLQKIVDSLSGAGWGNNLYSEPWYKVMDELRQDDRMGFDWLPVGTNASASTLQTLNPDGWAFGAELNTGTTNTGYAMLYTPYTTGGGFGAVNIHSGTRSNVGFKIYLINLSDGTDTYDIVAGFADNNTEATIVDGVYFRYTDADSSGNWILCTISNSTLTEKDSGVPAVINTDIKLEISVFGGTAYYFIDGVQVGTITTNIPTGTTRTTSVKCGIEKRAGTNQRKLLIDWGAYGSRSN